MARRRRPAPAPRLRARRRQPVAEPHRRRGHRPARPAARRPRPAPPRRAARALRARPDQEGAAPTPRATGRRSRSSPRSPPTSSCYILDEPTSGLDPLMEAVLPRVHRRGQRGDGRTVLLSSHILSEVEALCDRVSIIRDGPHGRDRHARRAAPPRPAPRSRPSSPARRPAWPHLPGVHDLPRSTARACAARSTPTTSTTLLGQLSRLRRPHPDQRPADPGGAVPAALPAGVVTTAGPAPGPRCASRCAATGSCCRSGCWCWRRWPPSRPRDRRPLPDGRGAASCRRDVQRHAGPRRAVRPDLRHVESAPSPSSR